MGGENQGAGPKAGFNRYWTGQPDINRMYENVKTFYKNPVPGPDFPSPHQPTPSSEPIADEGPVPGQGPKTAASPRSVITPDAMKGAQSAPKPAKESKPNSGPKPVKAHKVPKANVPKTNKVTGRMPTTCNCMTEAAGSGQCYSFNRVSSKYCTARACALKYVCVTRSTGVTCLRHKVTSKVAPSTGKDGVPVVDGTCTKQAASGDMYVPYTQGKE